MEHIILVINDNKKEKNKEQVKKILTLPGFSNRKG